MKWALIILLFVNCSGEKEIVVEQTLWTLIKKERIWRYEREPQAKLTWMAKSGVRKIEVIPARDTIFYQVGMKLVNRDPL